VLTRLIFFCKNKNFLGIFKEKTKALNSINMVWAWYERFSWNWIKLTVKNNQTDPWPWVLFSFFFLTSWDWGIEWPAFILIFNLKNIGRKLACKSGQRISMNCSSGWDIWSRSQPRSPRNTVKVDHLALWHRARNSI
jgi:hypothetical protein